MSQDDDVRAMVAALREIVDLRMDPSVSLEVAALRARSTMREIARDALGRWLSRHE